MNPNPPVKFTMVDFLIIIFFLLVATVFFVIIYGGKIKNTCFVVVFQNNKIVYKDLLTKNKMINLSTAVVEIKDKKVRIKESKCPLKICIHSGWISKPYHQLICIPNRIYIKILPSNHHQGIADSITY